MNFVYYVASFHKKNRNQLAYQAREPQEENDRDLDLEVSNSTRLSFLGGGWGGAGIPLASSSASLMGGGAAIGIANASTVSSAGAATQEQFILPIQQEDPADYSTGEDTSAIYSSLRKKFKKKTEVRQLINKSLKKN